MAHVMEVQSNVGLIRADRIWMLCQYTNTCQKVVSTLQLQVMIKPLNLNPYKTVQNKMCVLSQKYF